MNVATLAEANDVFTRMEHLKFLLNDLDPPARAQDLTSLVVLISPPPPRAIHLSTGQVSAETFEQVKHLIRADFIRQILECERQLEEL